MYSKGCYWSHSRQLRLWPLQKLLELRPKELVCHPSLRGNRRPGAHSSVHGRLTRALRSRPTEKSVIPAPDQFREREVFTSNTVGASSNLLCSTHCMLTRAMFTSNMSWDFIQLRCSTCRSSLELMFTSNMSWDFIQLRCSACRKLTRADVHFEHELGLHPTLIAALAACSLEQLRFRLAGGSRPLCP